MVTRGRATRLAAIALAAGAATALLPIDRGDDGRLAPGLQSPEQAQRPAPAPSPAQLGPGPFGARLLRPVVLRDRPRGRMLRSLGRRTEFGSERVLAVVGSRPGWLAVLTPHMPNSRAGWIPADGAQLLFEPYTLRIDLSARSLVVRHRGRVARRITVAVGRPGASTPTGRFAVTDTLVTRRRGSPYGCCALALTGRQPNLVQGWSGGDRLAIHGTPAEHTVGTRATAGCLRARKADMRWLVARVPLGAPVRIAA
jgi:lipoprotein-anchoring transpeptidase ErfK/SrfK